MTGAPSTPPGPRRFEGRTVLVTGASRGLGRALATAFADEGAFVGIGHHRHGPEAASLLEAVRARGGDGALLGFDVTQAPAVEAAVRALLEARGAIDVLVNNAGVARDELFALAEERSLLETLAVNVAGPWLVARAVARPMIARRAGVIVNIGSASAVRSGPGQAAYATSKAALAAFTRALALELAPRGVRVNAVCPGILATGMALRTDRAALARARAAIPLGRDGTAEEIAQVVLFVASDAAAYLVGQSLVVDGGLTL